MVRTSVMRFIAAGSVVMASVAVGPSAYGLASFPKPPAAPPVICGAVLTADASLSADLVCPDGNGLTIAADEVTLDLNGHSLVGPGADTDSVGIRVPNNFDERRLQPLTVLNGTIKGWGHGVYASDADFWPTVTFSDVEFYGNGLGVEAWHLHLKFDRTMFEDNGAGIRGTYASAELVRSTFRDNGGAIGLSPGYVRMSRSTVERSGGVGAGDGGCDVSDSRFVDNATALNCAWYVQGSVTNNRFVGNDIGVYTDWGGLTIEDNVFRNNGVGVQTGIFDGSFVRNNTFTGNATGFASSESDDAPDTGTTVEGNKFSRNGNGIYSLWPGVRLQGNTATNNTGWGIYAEGAIDLGGNIARHNGNEPQCYGVTCVP